MRAESEVITDTHEDSSLLGRCAVSTGKSLPKCLEWLYFRAVFLNHRATARYRPARGSPGICHLGYFSFPSFRPHYGPGFDSASNRNEYQEYFLGVKTASAYGWQPYHLHVPIVCKSWSLNLMEPSGTVQGCNGIALPLPPPFSIGASGRI